MAETFTKNDIWNFAGKAGLVLGLVSTSYILIDHFLISGLISEKAPLAASLVQFALWAAKFAGCIWLMSFFLKRFAAEHKDASHYDVRSAGIATALTSALIFAAFSMAFVQFIAPDTMAEAMEAAKETYSSMLDSNSLAAMDQMMDKMPVITLISNLIYCFLYGTVLSAILCRNIGSDVNPFTDNNSNE